MRPPARRVEGAELAQPAPRLFSLARGTLIERLLEHHLHVPQFLAPQHEAERAGIPASQDRVTQEDASVERRRMGRRPSCEDGFSGTVLRNEANIHWPRHAAATKLGWGMTSVRRQPPTPCLRALREHFERERVGCGCSPAGL
jgi:hypothetical protein